MTDKLNVKPFVVQIAVDGSEYSSAALQWIENLPLPESSHVIVLGVLTPNRDPGRAPLMAALEETVNSLHAKGIEANHGLLHGYPAPALYEFSLHHPPDVLVVGARGLHAKMGFLLGGVTQQIVEHSTFPVCVVRPASPKIQRVLLAIDASPNSLRTVDFLANFPLPRDVEVHVLHVFERVVNPVVVNTGMAIESAEIWEMYARDPEVEEREAHTLLSNAVNTLKSSGWQAREILLHGSVAEEIIRYAETEEINLVVAGSRGLGALQGWLLGSISRKLIYHSHCSVLIVPDRMEA